MGQLRRVEQSLLVVAAFSRHPDALVRAGQRLVALYGPIALASQDFDFHQTRYYEAAMGIGLKKRFLVFQELVESDALTDIKTATNRLEVELAESGQFPETRPLNLDPGLLQLGKFMLATTKDQAHRIYLRDGIYAEVTLRFQDGAFEPWPWTYADYREPDVRAFLGKAREFYRARIQNQPR
ncbi:MAG: DUF4416 family protein [Planctomycetes bacterium]|nr:DUF4416 family protein [Planctomycetota bacterium]